MDNKLLEVLTQTIGNYDIAKNLLLKLDDIISRFNKDSNALTRKYVKECEDLLSATELPSAVVDKVENACYLFILEQITDSLLLSAAQIYAQYNIKFSEFMYKAALAMEFATVNKVFPKSTDDNDIVKKSNIVN
jgi:hypothetical protein